MATIKNEFDYIQEARSQLAEALINKFGVRELDILNADGSIKSSGLWASNSDGSKNYLKRLHDWAVLVTATNVHTDASLTFKNDGNGDEAGTTFNGSVARSISYNSIGAASVGHTHTTKIETSTNTSLIALAYGGKYKLTAGGTTYVFTMPSSDNTWRPIGTGANDAAAGNHVHKNLIIKWGTGDTEGTNLFTYNGSTAKTIDLSTPFSLLFTNFDNTDTGYKSTDITATIGGTTKSFAVNWAAYAGRAQTADKWTTARTLTIGSTGKYVDGSKNVSWTLAEIGVSAAAHTHSVKINGATKTIAASNGAAVDLGNYLPLSGGTMSGNITINTDSEIRWSRNTDYSRIHFKNESDSDTNSYMGFETGDNGNGYFRFAGNSGGTITLWMSIKADGVRASAFIGNLKGNASTATKLESSAGNAALPIYFSDGKPVACVPSSLFSTLSNSGNNLSITIAGLNRTLTVNYANSAGSVAWSNITNKPINFKAHSGSLSSNGWKVMLGNNSSPSIAIAFNTSPASWNSGLYSATLVYGCTDTRGLLDCSCNTPVVTFGGCSYGGANDDNPTWYMKLSGTNGTTYNLNSMPYAETAGSVAWSNVTEKPSTFAPSSHTHSYLPLAGGTMTGAINFSNTNARLAFGNLTTSPITGYIAPELETEGVGIYTCLGGTADEGAIIITEDTCVIYNAGDTDWFLQVLDTDWANETTPNMGRVFGISGDGTAWALGGFGKAGSSDSYVLLGGGGHKTEASLSVNYANSAGTAAASTGREFWINGYDGDEANTNCPVLVMHWPNRVYSDIWYDGDFHFGVHNPDNSYNNGANLYANTYYADSDIRYKNIIKHSCIDLLGLATLPLFLYTWNDQRDDIIHIGSSAQAVELIIPELVTEDSKGFKSLNYSVLGTVAGITACKELVSQKSEIEMLKERVKLLELQLKMYNG